MIEKIISGGQIGADIAGLRAAASLGITTGGWIPKGFKTLLGSMPELALTYGLVEHESTEYKRRTYANVRDSDATIRYMHDPQSRGELCTLRAITTYKKLYYDIFIAQDQRSGEWYTIHTPYYIAMWLDRQFIKTLNIAGNATPSIEKFVEDHLTSVLRSVNGKD